MLTHSGGDLMVKRFDGQVISGTGDRKRCRRLLEAALEDLQEVIAGLELEDGEEIGVGLLPLMTDTLHRRFGTDRPLLHEEVVWRRVRRWPLSRWTQVRVTLGKEVCFRVPTGLTLDDRSTTSWLAELTVATDGVVQLSSSGGFCAPATELGLWVVRCRAEVPAEAQAAQKARQEHKQAVEEQDQIYQWRRNRRRAVDDSVKITPCASDFDLALSFVKLKGAKALLHQEIALRTERKFRVIVEIDGTQLIRCDKDEPRQLRLYEETLSSYGDPDDRDSFWKWTYTVGYKWVYGNITAVMTVNADGVVEISSGSLGARKPVTVENIRAVLGGAR
ncbi:hypothetical protein [Catenulispora pinisilvae]|uniref:hypothetical protein n=1 Tax=Catenulispora pinisilvae TaxID=2705253 RepID=UPI001890D04F|nr:hypothetical protein [Catenulispora pinisilvae]